MREVRGKTKYWGEGKNGENPIVWEYKKNIFMRKQRDNNASKTLWERLTKTHSHRGIISSMSHQLKKKNNMNNEQNTKLSIKRTEKEGWITYHTDWYAGSIATNVWFYRVQFNVISPVPQEKDAKWIQNLGPGTKILDANFCKFSMVAASREMATEIMDETQKPQNESSGGTWNIRFKSKKNASGTACCFNNCFY